MPELLAEQHSHSVATAQRSADTYLAMARDLGVVVSADTRLLDFGCGYGDVVRELRTRGFNADGVDIVPFWGEARDRYWEKNRDPVPAELQSHLHIADQNPYRMPFPDDCFDFIVSSQVFEHVMDFPGAMRELGRVLKPHGLSIHIFPSRLSPVEMHVFVPLATMVRARPWLGLWALLGIRNQFQDGLSWREVVNKNHGYLLNETTYPSHRTIRHWARESKVSVSFQPELFLAHHTGRSGRLARSLPFPGVAWLYETIGQRTMILRKA